MSYNHALEEKLFEKQWKKTAEEYRKSGMTEEQIAAIYEFDRQVFNSDRRYRERTIELYNNPCVKKMKVYDDYSENNRYSWIDNISDPKKYKKIMSLPKIWRDAFTMYLYDGYSQKEISSKLLKPQQTISYWIVKIAEILS